MAIDKRVGGTVAAAFMFTIGGLPTLDTAGADVEKPVIYLSFDDGPSGDDATVRLLEVLEDHGAQATFFVNGSNIDTAGEISALRRTLTDGHALASHSYQHVELDSLSVRDVGLQVSQNHDVVKSLTGHDMTCFRSPWGSSYTKVDREVPIIEAQGYQLENRWDIDASDYNVAPGVDPVKHAATVSRLVADQIATAEDQDTILMHDGVGGRQSTVDGVELFFEEHGDDYEFRAIPGCGGADDTTPTAPSPTPTPPSEPTPPPAGPSFSGPISDAGSVAELLSASDYRAADADYLRLYHALLARNPDISGSKYWLAQARQDVDLDAVAWSFAQSVEFQTKYGTLTDDQFVVTVYSNVLARTPDVAGRDYWLEEVRSARLSRHGVVRWMAESDEFRQAHPYNPS